LANESGSPEQRAIQEIHDCSLAFFTSPRLWGEVDTPERSEGGAGEGDPPRARLAEAPLTRLAALADLFPQAGEVKEEEKRALP
jgi:hypothetical protein